jgi:hypothetical protein
MWFDILAENSLRASLMKEDPGLQLVLKDPKVVMAQQHDIVLAYLST